MYRFGFMVLVSLLFCSCKQDFETIPSVGVELVAKPVNTSINGLAFTNGIIGYAACDSGILLKTTDRGSTWAQVSTFNFPDYDHIKIEFPDSLTGFIIAADDIDGNRLLKSADGGVTWTMLQTGIMQPTDFCFVTPLLGFMVTDYGMYKTTNGGVWWTNVNLHFDISDPYMVSFANKDTGFVKDWDYQMFRTVNGGVSWTEVYDDYKYASNIYFETPMEAFAVDGIGNVLKSEDGGMSWDEAYVSNDITQFYLTATDIFDQTGVIVGDYSIVVSGDRGHSWQFRRNDQGLTPEAHFNDVVLIDNDVAIACSREGAIYRIRIPQ